MTLKCLTHANKLPQRGWFSTQKKARLHSVSRPDPRLLENALTEGFPEPSPTVADHASRSVPKIAVTSSTAQTIFLLVVIHRENGVQSWRCWDFHDRGRQILVVFRTEQLVTSFSFVLCVLVGNVSAVYSADRCNFLELEMLSLTLIGLVGGHLIW